MYRRFRYIACPYCDAHSHHYHVIAGRTSVRPAIVVQTGYCAAHPPSLGELVLDNYISWPECLCTICGYPMQPPEDILNMLYISLGEDWLFPDNIPSPSHPPPPPYQFFSDIPGPSHLPPPPYPFFPDIPDPSQPPPSPYPHGAGPTAQHLPPFVHQPAAVHFGPPFYADAPTLYVDPQPSLYADPTATLHVDPPVVHVDSPSEVIDVDTPPLEVEVDPLPTEDDDVDTSPTTVEVNPFPTDVIDLDPLPVAVDVDPPLGAVVQGRSPPPTAAVNESHPPPAAADVDSPVAPVIEGRPSRGRCGGTRGRSRRKTSVRGRLPKKPCPPKQKKRRRVPYTACKARASNFDEFWSSDDEINRASEV